MVNITLAMPDEIKRKMEKFPEINWSEIARAAIIKRIILFEKFREVRFEASCFVFVNNILLRCFIKNLKCFIERFLRRIFAH